MKTDNAYSTIAPENFFAQDPDEKKKNKPVTNQDEEKITTDESHSPDLKGERPASTQDEIKRQQGAQDASADTSDITGKQVDDYFGSSNSTNGKDQLN